MPALKVSVALAQDMIKTIRLIALSGKENFDAYIYQPLFHAGWRATKSQQSAIKIMERIKAESRLPAYYHTIAVRCKRLILVAMGESFSILGDSCILFLNMMQIHSTIAASPESIEFANNVEPAFEKFKKIHAAQSETKFQNALNKINFDEVRDAFEPVKLDLSSEKVKLDEKIRFLYDNIAIASKHNNIPKAKMLIANYIIAYSDDESYAKNDVERLVSALNKRYESFECELREMIAIELYYRISKGILAGDVRATIQGIRKYAYIFEGNPNAKYFYEIDRLEKILYPMISDKKLWDSLKK
jgi:hypothetical protein